MQGKRIWHLEIVFSYRIRNSFFPVWVSKEVVSRNLDRLCYTTHRSAELLLKVQRHVCRSRLPFGTITRVTYTIKPIQTPFVLGSHSPKSSKISVTRTTNETNLHRRSTEDGERFDFSPTFVFQQPSISRTTFPK